MDGIGGDTTCELRVAGALAHSVGEALRSRFSVAWRRCGLSTVLTVHHVDQAAVRAVMVMLWDSGHDVLTMTTESNPNAHRTGGSDAERSDQAELLGGNGCLLT